MGGVKNAIQQENGGLEQVTNEDLKEEGRAGDEGSNQQEEA